MNDSRVWVPQPERERQQDARPFGGGKPVDRAEPEAETHHAQPRDEGVKGEDRRPRDDPRRNCQRPDDSERAVCPGGQRDGERAKGEQRDPQHEYRARREARDQAHAHHPHADRPDRLEEDERLAEVEAETDHRRLEEGQPQPAGGEKTAERGGGLAFSLLEQDRHPGKEHKGRRAQMLTQRVANSKGLDFSGSTGSKLLAST